MVMNPQVDRNVFELGFGDPSQVVLWLCVTDGKRHTPTQVENDVHIEGEPIGSDKVGRRADARARFDRRMSSRT